MTDPTPGTSPDDHPGHPDDVDAPALTPEQRALADRIARALTPRGHPILRQRNGRRATDQGASAVEYALMVAAIAALIVTVVFGLGTLVKDTFNGVTSSIETCAGKVDPCPNATAPPDGG